MRAFTRSSITRFRSIPGCTKGATGAVPATAAFSPGSPAPPPCSPSPAAAPPSLSTRGGRSEAASGPCAAPHPNSAAIAQHALHAFMVCERSRSGATRQPATTSCGSDGSGRRREAAAGQELSVEQAYSAHQQVEQENQDCGQDEARPERAVVDDLFALRVEHLARVRVDAAACGRRRACL